MLTQEAIFIATIKGTSLVIKTRPFYRSDLISGYSIDSPILKDLHGGATTHPMHQSYGKTLWSQK